MSFVNWPVGIEPENPESVLPTAMEDRFHGYYVFRNRWQDENDILVTALLGYGPRDAYKPKAGPIYLWGSGKSPKFSWAKGIETNSTNGPTAKHGTTESDFPWGNYQLGPVHYR
jgi:hypothetical protein